MLFNYAIRQKDEAARSLATGGRTEFDPKRRGGGAGDFSSLLRVRNISVVDTASCKMSIGVFPGGKDC